MKTLAFGEILWDIIEGAKHLGGAPLNFSAHVSQFGQQSAIISALGIDTLGDSAIEQAFTFGIDVTSVQRNNKKTGYVPINLKDGQPEYEIIKDVAYDYIRSSDLNHDWIDEFDTFYFGTIIQREKISRKALYSILDNHIFSDVFYDVNLRINSYNKSIIDHSLHYCTILKMNNEEVKILSEMIFGQVKETEIFCENITQKYNQIRIIIITTGKHGSLIYADNNLNLADAEPIVAVDTVGAGDAFSAAFVCSCFQTNDAVKSAKIANKVGGFVASNKGAIPLYSEELKKEINNIGC